MLQHVHWNPEEREKVIVALDRVLLELRRALEFACNFSDDNDTPETVKKMSVSFRKFEKTVGHPPSPPATSEELEDNLNKMRDRTSAELGHRERRILDISTLRNAVAEGSASQESLGRVQEVLISSVMHAIVDLHWGLESGENESISIYMDGLVHGFCIVDWDHFPFDQLPHDL